MKHRNMFLLYKGFSLESHHFWNDRLKTQTQITFGVQVHHYQRKKFRLIFWKIFEQYLSYLLTVLWPQKNRRTQQINVRFCIRDFLFSSYYKELARIKFSQMFSLQICFFHFVTLFVKETICSLNLLEKQFCIVTFPRKFARNSHFFQ